MSNVYKAGDRNVIQCNVRDVTERKQGEQQIHNLTFGRQTRLVPYLRSFGWLCLAFAAARLQAENTNVLNRPAAELAEFSLNQLMQIQVPTVVTASKHEQKVSEAPASVSIVTRDEIKKYGYRTLADILDSVQGSFVTYDRNYQYLGIRGFNRPGDYDTRVLLLVDGHRINDNIYDSATIGTEFILDIDLIERVEVIRGPGSSLYGNNAFFGVINVITRRGREMNGAEVSGEAGSLETYKGRFSYGNRFTNGVEMLVSGTYFHSEGHERLFFKEFNSPATNDGIAEDRDSDQYESFFSSLAYRDFALEGAFVNRTKQIPTGSFGTVFDDSRNQAIDEHGYVDLKFEHEFDDGLNLLARVAYDHFAYHGTYVYDTGPPGGPPSLLVNQDLGKGEWLTQELQFRKTLFRWHTVTVGGEFRENLKQDQANFDQQPHSVNLDDRRSSQSYGFYAQDEYQIRTNLILNAGVRYDYYSHSDSAISPRLALIYNPFPQTTLKLIYGKAFRRPNAYEAYYEDNITQNSNPSLHPETITTYEGAVEQSIGTHWRASASGFYYRINDLISQTTDPGTGLLVFRNIDEVTAEGFGLEVEGHWANGLKGRASYSFTATQDASTGEQLQNSPKSLVKLNLIVPLIKEKLFAGMELHYTSSRDTLAGNMADGYFLANLTLYSQNLIHGWEISASVYNLFDTKYGNPGGAEHQQDIIFQDGRTFRVKLTYKF